MAVKIRLARHGAKKEALYRIVVTDSGKPAGREISGKRRTYDPLNTPTG